MEKQTVAAGTPKEIIRGLRILTIAISAGLCIFLLLAVMANSLKVLPPDTKMDRATPAFLLITLLIAVLCVIRARVMYAKKTREIKAGGHSLRVKLDLYRPVLVLYIALCEGPALFSVIIFFLTGKYEILGVAGIMLVLMLEKMPGTGKLIRELDLDWREQEELN
ncbi:MAG: hypothetical protein HYZ15_02085 [Sphingobacteriales bacterium]|nr:hypothetical protein [Sphingobacteriales bacterium]